MFKAALTFMVAMVAGFWPAQPFGAVADRLVGANFPKGGALLIKRFPVTTGTTITGTVFLSNDLGTVFPKVLLLSGSGTRVSETQVLAETRDVRPQGTHWVSVTFTPVTISRSGDVYVAVALPADDGDILNRSGPALGAVKLDAPRDSYFASEVDDDVFGPMDVEYVMELVTSSAAKATAPLAGDDPRKESVARMLWTPGAGSSVILDFNLPQQASVSLSIHDVRGRLVSRLVAEVLPEGAHRQVWNGSDLGGRPAPSGVYIARLLTDQEVVSRKVVLAR